MIVYGDRERTTSVAQAMAALRGCLAAATDAAGGADEREKRVALAIACGSVAQGLLDRDFEARGCDERSPLSDAAAHLCLLSGTLEGALPSALSQALDALEALAPAGALHMREPEGYAFYALYPELYVAAATTLREAQSAGPVQVIGIRSIGTSLAGFVAAALGCARLPYTVRPVGHPYGRTLAIGPALEAALLAEHPRATYAVVDEGPGLSGSSFVAVAEWLIAHGVAPAQIAFLPSHAGEPGPQGAAPIRARYRATKRCVVPFEQVFDLDACGRWFRDHTGPLDAPVRDLSGGRWRPLQYADPATYPPSHVRDERRKYLLERDGRSWLMKYTGLGGGARARVARARTLSAHGFTPALEAARHGFTLSRWHAEALPLPRAPVERAALVDHLGRYLSFLARSFPVRDAHAGASPEQLHELAAYNASQLLGRERAEIEARIEPWYAHARDDHGPVAGDHKLEPHEWLWLPDGRLLKCDAEGHHADHHCIGCQDPAWDVAGAVVELALDEGEREQLLRALADRAGVRPSAEKLAFHELAYAAFRAGYAHFAELALAGWADDDAARFREARARYTARIARLLA